MYMPIIGTLGYVLSPDRTRTLLVHRVGRPHDHHFGKYNGLGGKMLPGEDVMSCLAMEFREEAGITCEEVTLRGTINWSGFGPRGENWLGFIFLITRYSGIPWSANGEGDLGWYPVDRLEDLPMWAGDRCVPGTAHVLKGEFIIATRAIMSKSQTQPWIFHIRLHIFTLQSTAQRLPIPC